jgi:hypothetical protein
VQLLQQLVELLGAMPERQAAPLCCHLADILLEKGTKAVKQPARPGGLSPESQQQGEVSEGWVMMLGSDRPAWPEMAVLSRLLRHAWLLF